MDIPLVNVCTVNFIDEGDEDFFSIQISNF